MTTILYLHGFLSSPDSAKVNLIRRQAAGIVKVVAPDLNLPPWEAEARILDSTANCEPASLTVIGASLGGFYAARLAAKLRLKAVLLNPCLRPWDYVPGWTGVQPIYGTDRTMTVLPEFADDFRQMAQMQPPESADGSRTLVVLSTKDEVIPWRQAAAAYAHSRTLIIPGGDHRISNFESVLPRVLDFVKTSV